jgi:DNA-binding LacI/PurR family transcriptional regulator
METMDEETTHDRSTLALPQYRLVMGTLGDEIRRGDYRSGRRFLTERAICARFNVSRTTAIRALSDLILEGLLTRQPGRGTFVVDRSASPSDLTRRGSRLPIGVICQDLSGAGGPAAEAIRGIGQVCRERDYTFLLFESDYSARVEAEDLRRARAAGVSGLIVYPVNGFENTAAFDGLWREGVPLVMIDRYYPTVPCDVVLEDNIRLGSDIVDTLVRLGHRRIALLGADESLTTAAYERFAGFRAGLEKHGIPYEPALATPHRYAALPDGDRQALVRGWFSAPSRPTAILAVNGTALTCVARDLVMLGIDLDTIALACMDAVVSDALMAQTTITGRIPFFEIGREATCLLLDQVEHGQHRPARHVYLPVTIQVSSEGGAGITGNGRKTALSAGSPAGR